MTTSRYFTLRTHDGRDVTVYRKPWLIRTFATRAEAEDMRQRRHLAADIIRWDARARGDEAGTVTRDADSDQENS